jgi:hypothetical protein
MEKEKGKDRQIRPKDNVESKHLDNTREVVESHSEYTNFSGEQIYKIKQSIAFQIGFLGSGSIFFEKISSDAKEGVLEFCNEYSKSYKENLISPSKRAAYKSLVNLLVSKKIFKPLNFIDLFSVDSGLNIATLSKGLVVNLMKLNENSDKISFLIENKIIDSSSFEFIFIRNKAPEYLEVLLSMSIETLKSLYDLGILNSFNIINSGINALEHEMVIHDLSSVNTRYKGIDYPIKDFHPLLNFTRSTAKVSDQIGVVIGKNFEGHTTMSAIRQIFDHYIKESILYRSLKEQNSLISLKV